MVIGEEVTSKEGFKMHAPMKQVSIKRSFEENLG
jgi:hypothetical protein